MHFTHRNGRGFGKGKQRPCAWCGAEQVRIFCQACYGPVDGSVKARFNRLIKFGSPKSAIEMFKEEIEKLIGAGVPMPARKMDHRERGNPLRARACRVCGCTDNDCRQCIERTGERCHWVASNLCSACAEELTPAVKESGVAA